MLANAWTHTPEDALAFYRTDAETGLTEEQVKRNRGLYGENSMWSLVVISQLIRCFQAILHIMLDVAAA